MEHALVCSSRRDSVVNLWGRCRSASQPDLSPFRFTPANMTLEITVFVIDDDPVERKTITSLVESMQLRAEAFASCEEFLDAYDCSKPGCLILDLRLPGMSGLELQKKLVGSGDKIPIIFISAYGDVSTSVQTMQLGAVTFLEKPMHTDELRKYISAALQIDTEQRLPQQRQNEMVAKIARLTDKERDVMDRIVAGKADKSIAIGLDISLRTVQFRKASIKHPGFEQS